MKKLLSILAAVGLTATAGATVVACGPSNPASDFKIELDSKGIAKDVHSTLSITKFTDEKGKYKDFVLVWPNDPEKDKDNKGYEVIEVPNGGKFDANGELTILGKKEDGEVTVHVEATEISKSKSVGGQEETKEAKKFISNDLTIKVGKKGSLGVDAAKFADIKVTAANLKDVTAEELDQAITDAQKEIDNTLLAKFDGIKSGTDYTNNLKDVLKKEDDKNFDGSSAKEIKIEAVKGSKVVKDDSKTTVKVVFEKFEKKNVSKIKLGDIVEGSTTEQVTDLVQKAIDELITGTEMGADWKFDNDDFSKAGNIVNVITSDKETGWTSAKLTGSYKIEVKEAPTAPTEIDTILTDEVLNLGKVESEAAATTKAEEAISKTELDGKVTLAAPAENKIHVSVKDEFKTEFAGEVDFTYEIDQIPTDPTEIDTILTDEVLNLGKVESEAAATTKAEEAISKTELDGKVTLAAPAENKIHVTVKDEFKTEFAGEVDFTYEIDQTPTDPTEIDTILTDEVLNLGKVESEAAATTKAEEAISKTELDGKVTLAAPAENKIHVSVKDEFKTEFAGEVDFTYEIDQIPTDPTEIDTILTDEVLNLGKVESEAAATTKAEEAISKTELDGKVTLAAPAENKIHVSVKDEFKTEFAGEVDFTYEVEAPTNPTKIDTILTGEMLNLGKVESEAAATTKATDVIAKTELNGKVTLAAPANGKIHVTVKEEAKKDYDGEVDFIYEVEAPTNPTKIDTILTGEVLNLGKVESEAAATTKATDVIAKTELNGKVTLAAPANGKIHVTVKEEAKKDYDGEVDFIYEVEAPTNPTKIDTILTGEMLSLGKVESEAAATTKATDVIAKTELNGKVTLVAPANGKIHVTVKEEAKKDYDGEVDFTYEIQQDGQIKDLKDLDLPKSYKAGEITIGKLKQDIQAAIDKLIVGTKENTDYTVTGNPRNAGEVVIKFKDGSKLLTGEFVITITA